MFNSTILDVMVGLVFVFLVVSLVASAVTEALASALKLRSSTLATGVKALLNDPDGVGIVKDLYNHALINPRDSGDAASAAAAQSKPAYIDPTQFANAMIELNGLANKTPDDMKQAIAASQLSDQTKQLLKGMVDRAQNDAGKLRDELATWFDNGMDRVSGAYKRMTQWIGFLAALTVTIVLNVDTIHVTKALWLQPMLSKGVGDQKFADTADMLNQLGGLQLPIGWEFSADPSFLHSITIGTILGWLITAVASLFGAPFWYDTLQSFVHIKGAGPSPAEKAAGG